MKKLILAAAILVGSSAVYAQQTQQTQDPIATNATYETNKLKDLNLTPAQKDAVYQLNVEFTKTMYATSSPASADLATIQKIRADREKEYKKILTEEQFNKWMASPSK
jgi:uncharacterized lipoprotein